MEFHEECESSTLSAGQRRQKSELKLVLRPRCENAQEAKDAARACEKIQKRLSEYKRRAARK